MDIQDELKAILSRKKREAMLATVMPLDQEEFNKIVKELDDEKEKNKKLEKKISRLNEFVGLLMYVMSMFDEFDE